MRWQLKALDEYFQSHFENVLQKVTSWVKARPKATNGSFCVIDYRDGANRSCQPKPCRKASWGIKSVPQKYQSYSMLFVLTKLRNFYHFTLTGKIVFFLYPLCLFRFIRAGEVGRPISPSHVLLRLYSCFRFNFGFDGKHRFRPSGTPNASLAFAV